MEELVYLKRDQALTDSIKVAEMFDKRHDTVLRAIENKIKNDSTQNCGQCFIKTRYKDNSGKWNTKYLMNRDGFVFIAMGFTGTKADEWKWKYIHAFDAMEKLLNEKQTTVWLETRKQGMLARREETDIIKDLVEYAKEQGSTHSDKLYTIYAKLANRIVGITKRDLATTAQLNDLSTMERIIAGVIVEGMEQGKHYKDIYKESKARLETVKGWIHEVA